MKMPIEDRTVVRDAALLRISRTRRWALAGAAALTAGLAALASALLPGKSFGAAAHSRAESTAISQHAATSGSSSVTPPMPAPANAAQLGVSSSGQPAQSVPAPQPTPAPQPAQSPAPAQSSAPAQSPAPAQSSAPAAPAP